MNPNGNANFPYVNENGNSNFNYADNEQNENWLWVVEVSNSISSPRYAGFVFLSNNRSYLEQLLSKIEKYLLDELRLSLHPHKVEIGTLDSGVDFLGWVNFPHHAVLRTTTKRRMLKNVNSNISAATLASYGGMLNHGNTFDLRGEIEKKITKLNLVSKSPPDPQPEVEDPRGRGQKGRAT